MDKEQQSLRQRLEILQQAVALQEILEQHADKRVVVVGGTCTGKSTLQREIGEATIDMDEVLWPLLTEFEVTQVSRMPWTPYIGDVMTQLARERLTILPGHPMFATVVLDADVVVVLTLPDEELQRRAESRGVSFADAQRMQQYVYTQVRKSGLPVIEFRLPDRFEKQPALLLSPAEPQPRNLLFRDKFMRSFSRTQPLTTLDFYHAWITPNEADAKLDIPRGIQVAQLLYTEPLAFFDIPPLFVLQALKTMTEDIRAIPIGIDGFESYPAKATALRRAKELYDEILRTVGDRTYGIPLGVDAVTQAIWFASQFRSPLRPELVLSQDDPLGVPFMGLFPTIPEHIVAEKFRTIYRHSFPKRFHARNNTIADFALRVWPRRYTNPDYFENKKRG